MKQPKGFLLTIVLQSLCLLAFSQKIDVYNSIYFPATPYGGIDQLQDFVKQEIIYPKNAIKQEIEGDVFITYLVDYRGKITFKEIAPEGDLLLKTEAERIFDKILWVADRDRNTDALGYEQIKFHFSIKKYQRLCKKRGYDSLPFGDYPINLSSNFYTINQVDEKPKILNSSSINQFIADNINYPSIALQQNISGRVTVEFIIEPYGKASNIRIIEALAGGCNEETIKLMKSIKWKPGFKDEQAVRTLFRYQLNFIHPGGIVR